MRAPNEKLIETLFTHHALLFLGATAATVYTPSTREEYEQGYDARLMGTSGFDELFLQFKTPDLNQGDEYVFATTEHQHSRLQNYPFDTAYYVTHLFRSIDQIQRAQREAEDPLDFLRWYLAIEIRQLNSQLQRLRYAAWMEDRQVHSVVYKTRADRKWERPKTPLTEGSWMGGDELLTRFVNKRIGAKVVLTSEAAGTEDVPGERQYLDRIWVMSPDRVRSMVHDDETTDLGTALRKNFDPRPLNDDP